MLAPPVLSVLHIYLCTIITAAIIALLLLLLSFCRSYYTLGIFFFPCSAVEHLRRVVAATAIVEAVEMDNTYALRAIVLVVVTVSIIAAVSPAVVTLAIIVVAVESGVATASVVAVGATAVVIPSPVLTLFRISLSVSRIQTVS